MPFSYSIVFMGLWHESAITHSSETDHVTRVPRKVTQFLEI